MGRSGNRSKDLRRRKRRIWIILFLVLFLLLAFGALAGVTVYRFYENIRPEVLMSAGDPLPDIDSFLVEPREYTVFIKDLSGVDNRKPGRYTVELGWGPLHKTSTLVIRDLIPPEGEVKDLTVSLGTKVQPEEFVTSFHDETEVTIRYASEPDFSRDGKRSVSVVLEDLGGNVTVLKPSLTIYDPEKVPVIEGAEDQQIYEGDSISYRAGVEVHADMDEAPKLSIDNSKVDLDHEGTYQVVYTAEDRFGRVGKETVNIRVIKKPENYGDMMKLNEMADQLLAELITDDMNEIEVLFAIFRWVRLNIPWISTGSHENEIEQATRGLEGNSGDCYTHAVAARVLLERAGFLVATVEKNSETGTHFWLMVYLNGGWYHMDPSPIYIRQFCPFLATDAQLKEYADRWRPHLYDLIPNPYPSTPLESPAEVVYKDGDYHLTILDPEYSVEEPQGE